MTIHLLTRQYTVKHGGRISTLPECIITTFALNPELTKRDDLTSQWLTTDVFGIDGLSQGWVEIYQTNEYAYFILIDAEEGNTDAVYRIIDLIQASTDYFVSVAIIRT